MISAIEFRDGDRLSLDRTSSKKMRLSWQDLT